MLCIKLKLPKQKIYDFENQILQINEEVKRMKTSFLAPFDAIQKEGTVINTCTNIVQKQLSFVKAVVC